MYLVLGILYKDRYYICVYIYTDGEKIYSP